MSALYFLSQPVSADCIGSLYRTGCVYARLRQDVSAGVAAGALQPKQEAAGERSNSLSPGYLVRCCADSMAGESNSCSWHSRQANPEPHTLTLSGIAGVAVAASQS